MKGYAQNYLMTLRNAWPDIVVCLMTQVFVVTITVSQPFTIMICILIFWAFLERLIIRKNQNKPDLFLWTLPFSKKDYISFHYCLILPALLEGLIAGLGLLAVTGRLQDCLYALPQVIGCTLIWGGLFLPFLLKFDSALEPKRSQENLFIVIMILSIVPVGMLFIPMYNPSYPGYTPRLISMLDLDPIQKILVLAAGFAVYGLSWLLCLHFPGSEKTRQ